MSMNQEIFWELIERVIEKYQGTKASYLEELSYQLETLTLDEVVLWDNYFEAYLKLADREKLWAAAFIMNKGDCDEDGFTDFRCWLISMGKSYYFEMLENMDNLADLIVSSPQHFVAKFEEIIYVGQEVYMNKVMRQQKQGQLEAEELYFEQLKDLSLGAEIENQLFLELTFDKNSNFSWNETSTKRFRREFPKLTIKYLSFLDKNSMKYEVSLVTKELEEDLL